MSHVVAVAAPIGAGKTSLVKAIADRLNDATTIHYDHYEEATERPAPDMVQWLKNGANVDDLPVPNLAKDLEKLKRGESVVDPSTHREIRPKKYIVFEMPLGKERKDTARLIDLLIWIEIPFDVALARKIREFTGDLLKKSGQVNHRDGIVWLDRYLDNYIKFVRDLLQIQKDRVSVNADIILDGQGDLETMVQYATKEILNRIP